MDRYLSDIENSFKSPNLIDNFNPIVYTFNNTIYSDSDKDLLFGETVIYPGQVNNEYFMTKGHHHKIPCAEVYYGLEGTAIVLCENDTDSYEVELTPGKVAYCKAGYAHRVINPTNKICRFFCVCRADAGHNYDVEFKKRYFSK